MEPQKHIPIDQAVALARIISKQYHLVTFEDWDQFVNNGIANMLEGCSYHHIPKKSFLPFEEAKKHVHALKLKTVEEWAKIAEDLASQNENGELERIPSNPAKHYRNEWLSWGDFLGTGHKIPSKFRSFDEAVLYVRNLCIGSCKEWQKYCDLGDRPEDIPHSPQKIYKEEWQGWNYFLGIGLYRQELYIETPDEELLDTIKDDISWDLSNIDYMMEIFREETDIDEDILKKYKNEPKLFLDGLKDYLRKYPREDWQ